MGGIMRYKLLAFALVAVLILTPIYAELNATTEVIDNKIYLDEQASFKLTVSNPDSYSKVINLYTTDLKWYISSEPSVTRIEGNTTKEYTVYLIPSKSVAETGPRIVRFNLDAPNSNDESIEFQVPVYIKSYDEDTREYNPSVELKVGFPTDIDPRDPVTLSIYMGNRNRLDIKNLQLYVQSPLFNDYKEYDLGPLNELKDNTSFTIDPLTKPQDGKLVVTIKINNRSINEERVSYKILPYTDFVKQVDDYEELFKTTVENTITNEGNIPKKESFRVPTTLIKNLFTKADPKPDRVVLKRGGYMEWDLTLDPSEETTIVVIENYRPIIYFFLIAIVISMIYFIYRSPVTIKKEAIVVGASSEGVSEMKVLLHVRNRNQELLENIRVTDKIPSLATHVKESHLGSLAPSKILKHQKRGTIIRWDLEALEPFEERILSYRMTSKIAIVGGFSLPPAKVKFETTRGKERTIRSNKSTISGGL